ncbi:hypothetical protein PybrP1_011453 [[Pythium] brassicae (nom. inval.)]|nr:hypothetical protein PybrP1_011453 [[Pythium] brassicae (nom. inval.)]
MATAGGFVRLLVCEVNDPRARFDASERRQLRDGSSVLSKVRLQGVCTLLTRNAQSCELQIGKTMLSSPFIIDSANKSALHPSRQTTAPVLLVRGSSQGACSRLPRSCERETWLAVLRDCNAESLRMLEILQLRQQSVDTARASAMGPLMLLALPNTNAMAIAGVKRKQPFASPTSGPPRTTSEQSPKPMLIEKPAEPPARQQQQYPPHHQERHLQQTKISSSGVGATMPVRTSVLPAAEYQFTMPPADEHDVESGRKTLEIRLNVPPYSIIRINDRILINGRTTAVVIAVRKHLNLQSVLRMESLSKLLPARAASGDTVNVAAAVTQEFRQFFSAAEEETNGLAVFELRVGSGASQAPEKSSEEWSQLLYGELAKKRTYGCSLADLQFAFPTLPVARITEILIEVRGSSLSPSGQSTGCSLGRLISSRACVDGQLQMDGVVYTVQDKYLLL